VRTEKEIYNMMMQIAQDDERIKAVYMNGSRTNKNVSRDIFQDYDMVYVVTDTKSFIVDKDWINKFGEIWFMQYPDEHPDFPSDKENLYGWLMQFRDGNRIDLHVESIHHAKEHIKDDKLCKILLDKENILPVIPEATDEDYFVKKPSKEQYKCTCTEFWWCLNNVAKGLWRNELLYANDMINYCVRKQLEKVISWQIGIKTDFSVSVGKSEKYIYKWLPEETYERFLSTYSCACVAECWHSVFVMIEMFVPMAKYVAENLEFEYDSNEERACVDFLNIVHKLPEDAESLIMK
jgi:aminoglycoside 6-adenylyltransferase